MFDNVSDIGIYYELKLPSGNLYLDVGDRQGYFIKYKSLLSVKTVKLEFHKYLLSLGYYCKFSIIYGNIFIGGDVSVDVLYNRLFKKLKTIVLYDNKNDVILNMRYIQCCDIKAIKISEFINKYDNYIEEVFTDYQIIDYMKFDYNIITFFFTEDIFVKNI